MREGFQQPTNGQATPVVVTAAANAPAGSAPVVQAEETSAPASPWPLMVRLRQPIIGNNREDLTQLVFREPRGHDINRWGNPVRIDSAGEVIIDERKMTNMMAQLSGVLTPLLEQLSAGDWNTCAYTLRPFFLPDPTRF